mmetsp:Transcript_28413/g.48019  ORF Transcript_28413/g.48019 Transcript_28413/m.48019 type:complete len:86 (-) Transcript_28413:515-772(-)
MCEGYVCLEMILDECRLSTSEHVLPWCNENFFTCSTKWIHFLLWMQQLPHGRLTEKEGSHVDSEKSSSLITSHSNFLTFVDSNIA